ncbi:uncharacterized protein [Ptychodera flava]|uniref:uncharacterized protein isoform X2 n=1 Tax=Ptychodera flava TaxID=63121 RepID=UPI00396A337F
MTTLVAVTSLAVANTAAHVYSTSVSAQMVTMGSDASTIEQAGERLQNDRIETVRPDCSNSYDCNHNGMCVSGFCSCRDGYRGAFCEQKDFQDPTDESDDVEYHLDESYTSRVIIVATVVSLLSIFGLCLCCICIALRHPNARTNDPPQHSTRPVIREEGQFGERRYSYRPSWYQPFESRRLSNLSANTLQLPDGRRVHIPSYPDGNSYDGDPNSPSPYLPTPDQPPEYNRVTQRQSSVPETPPPTYEAATRFKFRENSQTQLAIEEVPECDEVFYGNENENEHERTRIETNV